MDSGHHPEKMDDGSSASMDLNLMPYLAQVCIVQKVSSADDILNLRQAFPGGELEKAVNESRNEWMFEKVFPQLMSYLPLKDALNCRRVCNRWKRSVDQELEKVGLTEPDYTQTFEAIEEKEDDAGNWRTNPFSVRYAWDWDEDVGLLVRADQGKERELIRVKEEMDAHSGNPFPFRSVTFRGVGTPDYFNNAKLFLERFGKHVWKLHVSFQEPTLRSTVMLQDILRRTPNLRQLRVEMYGRYEPELNPQDEGDMEQRLTRLGFPALPHLQKLGWCFVRPFHTFAMPQYSETLVDLRVPEERGGGFLEIYDSRTHGTFPNLKLLEIWVESKEQLGKLTQLKSPLQNLTIYSRFEVRSPLEHHLDVYQHFAESLKCLTLEEFDRMWVTDTRQKLNYKYWGDKVWQFPKLVSIYLKNPLESLDILLAIQPGPKTLQIYNQMGEELPGETIQVHGYLNRMYESAIWGKMPRLETVKVEVYDDYWNELVFSEDYKRDERMEIDN